MADVNPSQGQEGSGGKLAGSILNFLKESYLYVFVIVTIIMLILPLPVVLLDVFMAFNLMFALLVLLIVLSTKNPIDFNLFPSILLFTTVFGLAINVSSTKLILSQGVKFNGRMIRAFSSFVVGSSGGQGIVIGFIIFIVLIIVQALVINKGAKRVAEVAARFTLDAMQMKMMAVESEFNQGTITEEEANEKKEQIRKESAYYGAMDGASNFIAGNVKAGIVITLVNIVGGIIIGVMMHGEPLPIAATNYISLAVGDGLLSQLPAFLVSVGMGFVVTRAAAVGDLPKQIEEQLIKRDALIYWVLAGVLTLLAVLPNFPWYVLIPMAAIVGFHAYRHQLVQKRAVSYDKMMAKTSERREEKPEEIPPVVPLDVLSLELGYGLVPLVEKEKGAELLDRVHGVRRQSAFDLGLVFPKVRIQDNVSIDPSEYCFKIKGVEVGKGKIRLGYYLCINPGTVTMEIEGEKTVDPAFGLPAIWIPPERRDEAERCGYTVVDPPSIIATHLTEIIRRNAADILGLQDVKAILDTLSKEYPAVVEEVLREPQDPRQGRGIRVTDIQKIFHNLLREGVSIRDKVTILETIAEYAPITRDVWALTEKARQALANQICRQYADEDRRLRVLLIDPPLEEKLIASRYETQSGVMCILDPPTQKAWISAVVRAVRAVKEKGWMPVILCSEKARYLVKNSTDRELPDLAVLSVPEIVPGIIPEQVGVIKLEEG